MFWFANKLLPKLTLILSYLMDSESQASLFFSLEATAMLPHHALLSPIFFHFYIKKQFPEVPFRKKVDYWRDEPG